MKNPGHIEPHHTPPPPPNPFREGVWLWPKLISEIEIKNLKNNYVLQIGHKAISNHLG